MLLTGVIVMAYAPVGIHTLSTASDAGTIAEAVYNWGYENDEVEGSTIANSVYPNNSEGNAELREGTSITFIAVQDKLLALKAS